MVALALARSVRSYSTLCNKIMANSNVEPEYSVYVGNLNPSAMLSDMEDLIFELFLQAGPLEKVVIPYDKDTGKHKGYGFVEFMHKESVQYTINLMNGICLLDRYLNVRTVAQRQLSVCTGSLHSTPPGTARVVEDNPFYSQEKPLTKISIPPPPSGGIHTLAASLEGRDEAGQRIESNPFLSSESAQSPAVHLIGPEADNPFLAPSTPHTNVTLLPSGSNEASSGSGGSTGLLCQTPSAPETHLAQFVPSTTLGGQSPTPLFPSQHQPIANPSPPPLLQQQAQKPKVLPLNPFLEAGYSPAPPPPPPNPFFQDLRCVPPLPPPPLPLHLVPPFPPPHFPPTPPPLPPPPPFQQTPPPLPLFSGNNGSYQPNSTSGQPISPFPDLSPSPSLHNSMTTVPLPMSPVPENLHQSRAFEVDHVTNSFHSPSHTPVSSNGVLVDSDDSSHFDFAALDGNQPEMDSEPSMNRGDGSWQQVSADHQRLHRGRIHANGHPKWLKRGTRAKLSQYHLKSLAQGLEGLKKSLNT